MNKKTSQLTESIIPFLILGIAIALIVGIFIMFSYVLFWGLIVGAVLWIVNSIKNFLSAKEVSKSPEKIKGNIFEHNDQD
ncbi:MAG: hypothetical protein H0U73_13760 [Tatlockia sp.]|nr:hypothetical protein [Tatlockia sp.]